MFREAIIPQVDDGKPFDIANGVTVYAVAASHYDMTPACVDVAFMGEPSGDWEDSKAITLPPSVIFQLAQALNPPIKVTQAVLEAMKKVPSAKFSMVGINEYGKHTYPCSYSTMRGGWYTYHTVPKALKIGDYIQADCPLALQVLLGFTRKGVPIDA